MPDEVVNVILQFSAAHFELLDLLIGRIINFFFDAVNRVVQSVIFVKHLPEMVIGALKAANHVAMFRKFPKDWMMKVHGVFFAFNI